MEVELEKKKKLESVGGDACLPLDCQNENGENKRITEGGMDGVYLSREEEGHLIWWGGGCGGGSDQ